MSDSYSAWCEEQEENSRIFSLENVEAAKSSKKFTQAWKRASSYCRKAVLQETKSCENCIHKKWLNSKNVCTKLGIRLDSKDCVCRYWSGTLYSVKKPEPESDVVAWLLLKNKEKQS